LRRRLRHGRRAALSSTAFEATKEYGDVSHQLGWRGRRSNVPEGDGGCRLTHVSLQDESTPTLQAAQLVRTMPPTAPAIQTTIEMGAQPHPGPWFGQRSHTASSASSSEVSFQKHAVAGIRKVASAHAEIGQSPVMTSTRFATDVEEQPGQR
jgi:hypothetical protein